MLNLKCFPVIPKDVFAGRYLNDFYNIKSHWRIGLLSTEHALKTEKIQNLIKDESQHFDLVFVEQHFQEAFYMFAKRFGCPLVTASAFGYTEYMDRAMGQFTPLSFVPHPVLKYTEPMSFLQRSYNVFLSFFESTFRRFYYLPAQNKLARKYFREAITGEIPHVIRLEKQVSIQLVNYHKATHAPRPKMPGQIDIAGAHIKLSNLNEDLKEFLDNAENGAVYINLGTVLRLEDIDKVLFKQIIDGLGALKQRVLVKYSGEIPEKLPPNVIFRQWFAQTAILSHPKVLLFVNHGGIFSMQEALYYGVPVLVLPVFGEQLRHGLLAERAGYATLINFPNLDAEILTQRISEMISNQSYKAQAIAYSELFRDNPIPPMKEAMYWIEYVIRNNGAKFMKSPSVDFPWCKYLLLDVALFYLAVFLLTILSWVLTIKFIIRHRRAKEHKGKFKYY